MKTTNADQSVLYVQLWSFSSHQMSRVPVLYLAYRLVVVFVTFNGLLKLIRQLSIVSELLVV